MTDQLDQFSVLDPERMQEQADNSVRTPFTVIDGALWRKKYNEAHGEVIDQWGENDSQRMVTQLAADTSPDWLPDGALIYADFVNGHYWNGGVCSANDILVEISSWAAWDADALDAALTENGLTHPSLANAPCIAPALATVLLSDGFSVVVDCYFADATTATFNPAYTFDDPDFSDNWYISATHLESVANTDIESAIGPGLPYGASKKFGGTISMSKIAICVNGGTVFNETPSTPAAPFTSIGISPPGEDGGANGAFRSLTFYAVLSDAELQALTA